jgi:RNA polymerase sigma-70 factor (ECF subfamily)
MTEPRGLGHMVRAGVMNASADRLVREEAGRDLPASRSFHALYQQFFDFVWRSLRRLGVRPALVEDAVQDTFIVVHRRLCDLRPDASAKAFVFAIALRVAHDYRRSDRRKGTESLHEEPVGGPETGPFEGTAKAEAVRVLERFLATLDESKRAVFVSAELEGMSAPEISEALDVPLNTVYSRLRVARERFVAFLTSQGGRHG